MPSSPPSPSGTTPGTAPRSVVAPAGETRRTCAVSRKVIRAEPSGRKLTSHGTSRWVARTVTAGAWWVVEVVALVDVDVRVVVELVVVEPVGGAPVQAVAPSVASANTATGM